MGVFFFFQSADKMYKRKKNTSGKGHEKRGVVIAFK